MPFYTNDYNMGQAQSLAAQSDTPEENSVIQQADGISITGAAAEVTIGPSDEISSKGAAGESAMGQTDVTSFKGAAAKVCFRFASLSEGLHLYHDDTKVKGRIAYVS